MEEFLTKIYRADFREVEQGKNYIIRNTKIDGDIFLIRDICLEPQSEVMISFSQESTAILIPLFGGVDIDRSLDNFVGIGNYHIIKRNSNEVVVFSNPYDQYTVHFLVVYYKGILDGNGGQVDYSERNKTLHFLSSAKLTCTTGIFDARHDNVFKSGFDSGTILAYVIGGAFEFENRLLEVRDALQIHDVLQVEFEALSENAMLLIFGIAKSKH